MAAPLLGLGVTVRRRSNQQQPGMFVSIVRRDPFGALLDSVSAFKFRRVLFGHTVTGTVTSARALGRARRAF
jgi:hypothetical protein